LSDHSTSAYVIVLSVIYLPKDVGRLDAVDIRVHESKAQPHSKLRHRRTDLVSSRAGGNCKSISLSYALLISYECALHLLLKKQTEEVVFASYSSDLEAAVAAIGEMRSLPSTPSNYSLSGSRSSAVSSGASSFEVIVA